MVDASIPLQTQTPAPPDPMQQYGRVLALQGAMQGQQVQAAQLQGAQQENQQRQIQMDNMQKLNKLYMDSLGSDGSIDSGKLSTAMAANGLGSQIPTVLKGVNEFQTSLLDLKNKQTAVANAQADTLGALGNTLQKANYDPQLFLTKVQAAINAKAVDPNVVAPQIQKVQQALLQDPTGGAARQLVKTIADSAVDNSQKWTELQSQAKTAQGAADRGTAEVGELNIKNQLLPGQLQGQQLTNTKTQQETTGTTPLQPKDKAELALRNQQVADENTNTAINRNKFNLTYGQGITENGQSLLDARANMIANLQDGPPSKRDPMYGAIMSRVQQIRTQQNKPAYDTSEWTTKQDAVNDFSSKGKSGQAALALNTLVRHTDDMIGMAQALQNGNFTPGNALYQKAQQIFGSNVPTNYDQLKQYIVGETVKLVRGAGGSEGDVEKATAPLNRAGSPAQLMGALQTNFAVAGGKMQALNEAARKQGLGDNYTVLDPGAADIMKNRGYDPGTLKSTAQGAGAGQFGVTAPNGKTYHFKSQADANNFKKEAGIQ